MTRTWLPSDTRQRIQDLIKDSSVTQAELAGIIGLSESALSRYLKGQTEMLGDGYIIKISRIGRITILKSWGCRLNRPNFFIPVRSMHVS